jgi:MFS family permease
VIRRLLADRNFRLLLAGQTLTMFGDVALFLVLAIWVKDLTGSDGAAGAVFLALVLPMVVAPVAAVWVDRFPRRRVMIANDIATGVVVLALLLVHDRGDVWLIYAVAAFYGVSQQVFFAARSGLLARWLDQELLGDANGLLESVRQGLRVVGPVTGAALFGVFGGGATAALDAATFFASAFFLSLLRIPDIGTAERGDEGFLAEVSEGARHILRTPELRRMVLVFVVALCVVGFLEPALFALTDDGLGRPPEFVGVIGMLQGLGSVFGGVLAGRALRTRAELPVMGVGTVLCGLGLAPLALATVPAVFAGCFALGVGLSIVMVGYFTLLQRRTANELQGRVFAAAETALNIPYAASIGAGAALIATVGFRVMYLVNAVVLGLCGVYLLASRVRPVEIPEVIEELSDGARAGVEARPAAAETTRLPQGIVPPE